MTTVYANVIRTVVPAIVGFLLTQALRTGVHLDQATVTDLVQTGLTAGYYTAFRWAEHRLSPKWGWALGWVRPQAPAVRPVPGPAAPGA